MSLIIYLFFFWQKTIKGGKDDYCQWWVVCARCHGMQESLILIYMWPLCKRNNLLTKQENKIWQLR